MIRHGYSRDQVIDEMYGEYTNAIRTSVMGAVDAAVCCITGDVENRYPFVVQRDPVSIGTFACFVVRVLTKTDNGVVIAHIYNDLKRYDLKSVLSKAIAPHKKTLVNVINCLRDIESYWKMVRAQSHECISQT